VDVEVLLALCNGKYTSLCCAVAVEIVAMVRSAYMLLIVVVAVVCM
jgi:hypothetical protein